MKCNWLFSLVFFCPTMTLAADGLGRLFLTPEQRAQLDMVRAQRDRRLPVIGGAETTPIVTAPVPQGPEVVTYDGVVRRSDGKSTVWINGKPVNERGTANADGTVSVLGVRRDGAVSVAIPQVDRRASLKVGQSLDVNSGTIEESYARRATLIRPQETAPAVSAPAATPAAVTPAGAVPIATPALSPTPPPAATPMPSASVAGTASTKPASRPVRESDNKEADPESGAAPAIPRGAQK